MPLQSALLFRCRFCSLTLIMRMMTSDPASAATTACAMTMVSPKSRLCCIRCAKGVPVIRATASASSSVAVSDSTCMSLAGSLFQTVRAAVKRGSCRALRRISSSTICGTQSGPSTPKSSRSLLMEKKFKPGPASMMGRLFISHRSPPPHGTADQGQICHPAQQDQDLHQGAHL